MTSPSGDRNVRIVVAADVAAAIRGLRDLSDAAGNVGNSAQQAEGHTTSWGDSLKKALAFVGVQTGFDGIKAGFQAVIGSGLDYEQSMNTLRAVTGANDTQMRQLGDTAKALGNDVTIPGASASDAAAAMMELAKGGLTAQQAMDASRGTMILAAAAQIDGAQAAEIQANALNTFGLSADQAGRVANVLANVANQSSGEITDFSQALQQSGTVASSFGWSIEETTTVLGLMANAGIKGSDAGTSLKTTMTAMLNPTQQQAAALEQLGIKTTDANGKMISAQQLTDELAAAKGRMTDAEFNSAAATAFGTDAVRTALVVANQGAAGYAKMSDSLFNATGAQDVAAANTRGLSGALDRFKNSAQDTALTLYQNLSPALTSMADFGATAFSWLGDAVSWFGQLPAPIQAATVAIGAMVVFRGPLTAMWTSMSGAVRTASFSLASIRVSMIEAGMGASTMQVAMMAANIGVRSLGTALKTAFLSNPIGIALVGVTTALSFFASKTDDAAGSQQDFAGALDNTTGKLNDQAAATISSKVASSGLGDQYKALGGNVADLVDAIGGIPEKQALVQQTFKAAEDAAQSAGGAYTNAGAAIAAGGGQMTLSNDQLSQSTEALTGKLAAVQGTSGLYTQLLGEMSGAQNQAQISAQGLTGQLGQAGDKAGGAAGGVLTFDQALQQVRQSSEKATDKATPFTDALKDMRDASGEADANVQFLSITLLQMAGNQVPAEQQARANAAAFREVGQATRDIGDANDSVADKQKKLDDLTAHLGMTLDGQAVSATNAAVSQQDVDAAARDLATAQANVQDATDKQKDALDKAAQSARDMTAEAYNNALGQGGMQAAIQAAVQTMTDQRTQFIQSAVDAGVERGAAEQLADAQGLIPSNVQTAYTQTGAEDARKRAEELNAALDKINDRSVHYTVVGGEVTTEGTMRATSSGLAVYADGGHVRGPGTGRSDSILARVSNGEFVSTADTVGRGGNRAALEFMHAGGTFPGFADGGVVNANVIGEYQSQDLIGNLEQGLSSYNKKLKEMLTASVVGGMNLSQDPSSFGWKRASNIQGFSWDGLSTSVAGGTQSLWTALLNSLAPTIPGGVISIGGFDDRNNVNSPGVPSFHAYGLAMDINAAQNPNGVNPASIQGGKYVIPIGAAEAAAARLGMLWGGDFNGTKDPMHFEIHVSPGQIGVGGAISTIASNLFGGFSGGGTAGVSQWAGTVLQALALTGQPASYSSYVLHQMMTESSGNQFAINNWDSNAQRGDPSRGLMQVIGSTFNAYRLPGLSGDIYDPLSNIVAAIRYVLARYGSIPAGMQGHAYDTGGIWANGTAGWNTSGGPEYVLKPWQWAAAQSAIQHVTNNAGASYQGGQHGGIHIENLTALQPGQATAELDYALARCR